MQAFCASKGCENLKLVIASAFVFLLIVVAFIGISLSYCVLQVFPLVNFIILFICLTLLAYVEALHYACVAVEKWDMAQYAEKFPRAVRCHSFVDTPEKVKQFLVGRQFFVIFVVFLIAQITSFPGKLAATHYDDDDEQAQQCSLTYLLEHSDIIHIDVVCRHPAEFPRHASGPGTRPGPDRAAGCGTGAHCRPTGNIRMHRIVSDQTIYSS